MESADLHHHHQHHQEHDLLIAAGSSSSSNSLTTLPSFSTSNTTTSFSTNNNNAWNPNLIHLLADNLNSNNVNGFLSNNNSSSSYSRQQNSSSENILVSSSSPNNTATSMIQELGFHEWVTNSSNGGNNHDNFSINSTHDDELHHHLSNRIKEEISSENSFLKFNHETTNNINPTSNNHLENFHFQPSTSYIKNEHHHLNDILSEKLLLKTFSSSCQLNGLHHHHHQVSSAGSDHHDQFYPNSQNYGSLGSNRQNNHNFNQTFPTNSIISNSTSCLGMNNLQTLDLWNPNKFGGCSIQPQQNSNYLGLIKQVTPSYVLDHHHYLQESCHTPSHISNKISSFMMNGSSGSGSSSTGVGVKEITKRSSSSSTTSSSDHYRQPKLSHHHHHQNVTSKRPRTESSRSSFPPFKVRKEKLGDRIAALQQLVAPFGKTDTASVLMEAIGYIKFLQDQVETLSVPYMKSTRNLNRNSGQGGLYEMEGSNEVKKDLRSRGLCLVPLSCTTYVNDDFDSGVGIWSVPNFGGGGGT